MKYVVMADGDMKRWHAESDTPKHLLKIGSETLLERLVRQIRLYSHEDKVIITSHNRSYEVPGAMRYEPKNNHYEIDRFTWELIEDDTCFLYGDTFYTDDAIDKICRTKADGLYFLGNESSIVALIVHDGDLLKEHIKRVKDLYLKGKINECRGWQVYQSYENLPFGEPAIGPDFTQINDATCGFNTWSDYQAFMERNADFKWMSSSLFEKLPKS